MLPLRIDKKWILVDVRIRPVFPDLVANKVLYVLIDDFILIIHEVYEMCVQIRL